MSSPLRVVEDHHVDRLGVEAWRHVKLTSPNRSIGLIALISPCPSVRADDTDRPTCLQEPRHTAARFLSETRGKQDALRRPGGYSGVVLPDPISNSVVKRSSADGTLS